MNMRIFFAVAFAALWIQSGDDSIASDVHNNVISGSSVMVNQNAVSQSPNEESEASLSIEEFNKLMSTRQTNEIALLEQERRKLHYYAHAPHVMAVYSGMAFLTMNEDREALRAFEAAIAYRPLYAEAHAGLGIALQRLMRSEDALRSLDEAVRLEPGKDRYALARANMRSELGDSTGALDDYTRALEINPNNNSARYFRAVIYQQNGRLKEAEQDHDVLLDPASKLDTRIFPLVYIRKGTVAADRGNMDTAVECFSKLILMSKGGSEEAWAYGERGNIFYRQCKYKEALSDFETAIMLAPKSATDEWKSTIINRTDSARKKALEKDQQ